MMYVIKNRDGLYLKDDGRWSSDLDVADRYPADEVDGRMLDPGEIFVSYREEKTSKLQGWIAEYKAKWAVANERYLRTRLSADHEEAFRAAEFIESCKAEIKDLEKQK